MIFQRLALQRNLECPNPDFAQVEGCWCCISALLTLMSILQFFRPNNEIA
jgi:hypothetical protein